MGKILSLHYSPCPNDTFIFGGLAGGHVNAGDLRFSVHLADVEELNQRAFAREADVIKVSYHAFLQLSSDYVLLDSGSALGKGVGPLVIAREPMALHELQGRRIAIPGEHTTAHMLLKLFAGKELDTTALVFSDIEGAVLRGEFDAGVIIHENRFTYALRGLVKVADLGEYWEQETGLPIPLGGIVARRSLGRAILDQLEQLIRESIDWAVAHPGKALPYIRAHAQEMDEQVMMDHIGLYVTPYTRSLGEEGRRAIHELFRRAAQQGIISGERDDLFR
ncbi:MAG TPA: 1,4-dihydroxy-6-naphthoate synthase [Bacteroidales bacterium]|nr:1,4-dihydroxy-6-naphthoate synthase [Bacteroidales bacterium]